MFTPTRTPVADQPPSWSMLDVARPIGDLPGITDAEQSWAPGVRLWWLHSGAGRWPHRRQHTADAASSYYDADVASIADPSVWATPLDVQEGGQTVYSAPDGVKDLAPEPQQVAFRSFTAYAPQVELDLAQDTGEAADRAAAQLRANLAGQIMAEFADSLYTKNPGLYRTAEDISNPSPVDPAVGMSVLAEAYGVGYPTALSSSADGDHCITVPYHAIPLLVEANLARWVNGRLLDAFDRPLNTTPGLVLDGPLTDAADLETSVTPTAGTGWFYISPRPYAAVGTLDRVPTGEERAGRVPGHSGVHVRGNRAVGVAEGPAIVVFRPVRTYAVQVSLNKTVG